MSRLIPYLLFSISILTACGDNDIAPDYDKLGYGYFPLIKGHYVIYDVENIEYPLNGDIDTSYYQLKETVVDSFSNQVNTYTYIVHRSKRLDETASWDFFESITARRDAHSMMVYEGNTPYVKLSFPVANGRSWDGNSFNTQEEDEYKMGDLKFNYTAGNDITYENILSVLQEDNQDFIVAYDRRYEVYGLGVGLLYKENIYLEYCTENACLGQQEIVEGHIYKQDIIAYGKE